MRYGFDMRTEYNYSSILVNNPGSLIEINRGYKVIGMKYGERLKQARDHAGLTQKALADRIANVCTQENISKLEKGEATGSEFTAQFADACGVNAIWLAAEKRGMIGGVYVENERLKRALALMEPLPSYAIDHVIREIAETAKLLQQSSDEPPTKASQ